MALISEMIQLTPIKLPTLATLETDGLVTAQGGFADKQLGAVTVTKELLGVSPSGSVVKTYSWRQTDKLVLLQWMIRYQNPGTAITVMSVPFPTDCPQPIPIANQENDSWIWPGDGGLFTSANVLANGGAAAGIYRDANGALTLRAIAGVSSIIPRYAVGVVSYITT